MQNRTEGQRVILNPKMGEKKFRLSRYLPSPDLEFFVERYWVVEWDLRDQEPYIQETLPNPTVHMVFEKGASAIHGVVRSGRFAYLLAGKGRVFGVKYRPGAFYPFLKSPVSLLTDRSVSISNVFDAEDGAFEDTVLSTEEDAGMVELVESFIRQRLPERDEKVEEINRILEYIVADREIVQVGDLLSRFELSRRTLQRMFTQYVGVSPKWVIRRYRLQGAADRLTKDESVECAHLAQVLGYFDQAHFIKDFKSLIGVSPARYKKNCLLQR